jgi:hypothetical protein
LALEIDPKNRPAHKLIALWTALLQQVRFVLAGRSHGRNCRFCEAIQD